MYGHEINQDALHQQASIQQQKPWLKHTQRSKLLEKHQPSESGSASRLEIAIGFQPPMPDSDSDSDSEC